MAKYITLKEAAKISGYAPDYIGQLIRKGKIPGTQIYCNIAWMTTEEALKEYVEKSPEKKEEQSLKEKIVENLRQKKIRFFENISPANLFKMAVYFVFIISLLFSFLLFYIFSVNFEKRLEQRTMEKVQNMTEIH